MGHAGTLDPFATGLLLVLVGKATRLARFLAGHRKVYQTTVRFGTSTDSDDRTGSVVQELMPASWPSAEELEKTLAGMCGTVMQQPPTVSAKHVNGERSYRLARRGVAVELQPVPVEIHRLEMTEWTPPDLKLTATVGSGTYVRAIARDLGRIIGIPAHCAELRRTAIGGFQAADAVPADLVDAGSLIPAAAVISHLPREELGLEAVRAIGFGRDVPRTAAAEVGGYGALIGTDGQLVAVGVATQDGWHPDVVLEGA